MDNKNSLYKIKYRLIYPEHDEEEECYVYADDFVEVIRKLKRWKEDDEYKKVYPINIERLGYLLI
jgi:hypothetical protein